MTLSAARYKRFLADSLTMGRFAAAALVWMGLSSADSKGAALALIAFLAGAISDFLDGRLAREAGGHTAFGRIVDPLADKALILSALAGLSRAGVLPWWLFGIVAVRDLIVTAARFRMGGEEARSAARGSGKWKTALQVIFLISALWVHAFWVDWVDSRIGMIFLLAGSALIAWLTIWSGVRFLVAGRAAKTT